MWCGGCYCCFDMFVVGSHCAVCNPDHPLWTTPQFASSALDLAPRCVQNAVSSQELKGPKSMALSSATRSKSALVQLARSLRSHSSSSIEVVAVAVPDQGVTSVALEPELAESSSTITLASRKHALAHFLGSVVGCSQHALAQAASDANVRLQQLQIAR